jgi:integrase
MNWFHSCRRCSPDILFNSHRRHPAAAGIGTETGCHTFRATGITAYLANGGAHAQEMAAHESPRTTKLYDRKECLAQDEVEGIRL